MRNLLIPKVMLNIMLFCRTQKSLGLGWVMTLSYFRFVGVRFPVKQLANELADRRMPRLGKTFKLPLFALADLHGDA